MSLYGALRAGVAGLNANSNRIAMISDNIANANTDGYKRVSADFSTFVTETNGGRNRLFSNGGVRSNTVREIDQQGLIRATDNTTDIAVRGSGYFVVSEFIEINDNGEFTPQKPIVFTRVGDFRADSRWQFTQ